ncbi:hypothetical protein [Nocardioides plantarum]|uniref:Uncharacterized protein n=1 Tax=Nocardioides plantarum TaxID=29299 RepID=A0ABV5KCR2_9ACTN|nr:hypothetical protein [Nocardioides plantarum]
MHLTLRRSAGAAAALATVLTTVLGSTLIGSSPAQAATLDVTYDAVGTSTIKSTGSVVDLGPTTLTTALESADGSFTGHLPLPTSTAEFKLAGFLPVQATVDFIEAAPVTGALVRSGATTTVTSTATYFIKLSHVKIGGIPAFVGNQCRTAAPVVIPANSPAGQTFNIISGGRLAGTYTIGSFQNCNLSTGLLNLIVPGAGNTVDLTVSNGRLG